MQVYKRFLVVCVVLVIGMSMLYAWLVRENNRDLPPVAGSDITASFEAAVGWLEDNRTEILQADNPALWWMVQRSANLTGDTRLLKLFDTYQEKYKADQSHNYWRLMFRKRGWMPVRYEQIEALDDYQQFMVYAITCDAELSEIPLISAQLDPSFCDAFPFRSSCVTHQMMGLHLLMERGCGDAGHLKEPMEKLQFRVRNQLAWDPRLLDQYLQRVLMLLETGAAGLLKPVWLQRVVDGTREDGGWPYNRLIADLPGKYDLIFTRNFIGLGEAGSNFHATAQGLLIMAHLLNNL